MILKLGWKALLTTVAVLSLMATGCSSHRVLPVDTTYQSATIEQRFQLLTEKNREWSQLSIPLKVEISSPSKLSVSGRVYMERDRYIYLSLRFLGMEMASMYVNSDSVYVTDKLNKRYLAENISDITAGASVTIGDIQDLLLGRVFINGSGTITPGMERDVILAQQSDVWTITPKKGIRGITYNFAIGNADNILRYMTIEAGGRKVKTEYSSPVDITDRGRFTSGTAIDTSIGSKQLAMNLKWTFSSAKWTISNTVMPPRNKNYTRIKADQLMKLFSSF